MYPPSFGTMSETRALTSANTSKLCCHPKEVLASSSMSCGRGSGGGLLLRLGPEAEGRQAPTAAGRVSSAQLTLATRLPATDAGAKSIPEICGVKHPVNKMVWKASCWPNRGRKQEVDSPHTFPTLTRARAYSRSLTVPTLGTSTEYLMGGWEPSTWIIVTWQVRSRLSGSWGAGVRAGGATAVRLRGRMRLSGSWGGRGGWRCKGSEVEGPHAALKQGGRVQGSFQSRRTQCVLEDQPRSLFGISTLADASPPPPPLPLPAMTGT